MTSAAPDRSPPGFRTPRGRALAVVAVLLGMVVTARYSVLLAPAGADVAAFWPNAGLSIVALSLALPRWRPWVVVAIGLVVFLGNREGGRPADLAAAYGVMNAVESGLVIWLLTRRRRFPTLRNLEDFIRFAVAVLAGAGTAALLGGAAMALFGDGDPVMATRTLFVTHGAALLLIPPLVMRLPSHSRPAGTVEVIAQSALLAAATAFVYSEGQSLPLAFMPFPLLVWGAARLRPREVVAQLIVFAVTVSLFTVHGNGPFWPTAEHTALDAALVGWQLQANVIAATLVTLPLTLATTARLIAITRLARTNQMMNNIVEGTTTTAILGTDRSGRIEFFNTGAENLTGYRAEDVVGVGCVAVEFDEALRHRMITVDVGREPDRESLEGLLEPFLRGEEGNIVQDSFISRVDGEVRTISLALSRRYDAEGQPTGYLGVANDVTERRRHEQMVEAALAAQKEVNDRLAQLDETKNDFLSTVSHELRTPITSIIGYSQLLLADESGSVSATGSQIVERIERNGRRLMGLIEDMMAMSQFEMADVRFHESTFDLREVVTRALDGVDEGLEVRKLRLERDLPVSPVMLTGDADKLERAFVNVLSNAVKFSRDGDSVSVELTTTADEALFCVADTGIGISDTDRVHMFDRFFRGSDAREMAIQGAGLGLAITNSIVQAHRGRIDVESTVGHGSRFTIRLPVGAAR